MSKPKNRFGGGFGFDDFELFNDPDFELETFLDSMEGSTRPRRRTARERLEDWRESRWLRQQLSDWPDWSDRDLDTSLEE